MAEYKATYGCCVPLSGARFPYKAMRFAVYPDQVRKYSTAGNENLSRKYFVTWRKVFLRLTEDLRSHKNDRSISLPLNNIGEPRKASVAAPAKLRGNPQPPEDRLRVI
jgi:hypothetical protein